jgi:hypothetical protein
MPDEAEIRLAGAGDRSGHPNGGPGDESPFQTRAQFLKNWSWQSVIGINCGTCERGRAQHGLNSETSAACAQDWETQRNQALTLGETIDFLRQFHRRAPFLFFNGNTFAAIGRQLSVALFSDLPSTRLREIGSAIAHYIAGVLDRESMMEIVENLCLAQALKPGDKVKTLRGSTRGVIVRVLSDGRVAWKPVCSESELIALPESLVLDNPGAERRKHKEELPRKTPNKHN